MDGCLPDLLRDVGEESESVFDPDESIKDFFLKVGGQLVDATSSPGVERDLVSCVMISEDEPTI